MRGLHIQQISYLNLDKNREWMNFRKKQNDVGSLNKKIDELAPQIYEMMNMYRRFGVSLSGLFCLVVL